MRSAGPAGEGSRVRALRPAEGFRWYVRRHRNREVRCEGSLLAGWHLRAGGDIRAGAGLKAAGAGHAD